ncbi:hypothetical protein LOAG_00209 [Loa loa]|uniref:Uncharacterized protein n=1 Tax=Loa loa TaxID=7209 RepID=A0A1I7VXC4_LOALO|nr:hypothetical protein LOAG_00209 [Loa loa]EFO28285.2 hypothetical protein LOAG_00209 [Loa loa]
MDLNIGIDSKPRTRRGRPRFTDRLVTLAGDRNDDTNDPISTIDSKIALNVRVKERENGGTKKGPLGSIFKDTSTNSIKGLFYKESSHDLKDSIRRPLTGLFRRPNSRANPKFGSKNENRTGTDVFVPEVSNYRNEHTISRSSATSCFEGVLHDVANAPSINVNQISTVYQLDFMNAENTSLAKLDDIDLSLLSRFLCTEEEVNDEKTSWTWDYLFASVSTEMRDEWMQDEGRDDSDYGDENLIK